MAQRLLFIICTPFFALQIGMLEAQESAINAGPKKFEPPSRTRILTLKGAIEEGLRNNPDERVRDFDRDILQNDWRDRYDSFWFPNVNLSLTTSTDQRIQRLSSGGDVSSPTFKGASGALALEIKDYTLFNWGRDYLEYQNARATFKRNHQILDEKRRDLKHRLIVHYFKLSLAKTKTKIFKEQLKNASFIYRLGREKANLRKISKQEYLQARNEFLRAQSEYQQAKIELAVEDEQFAYILGDELDTVYRLRDDLQFRGLSAPLEDLIKWGKKSAPLVLDSKVSMENFQRDYEKAIKDDLPLPKLSFNLGTYTYSFDNDFVNDSYSTFDNSKSIELVASISASWSLLGDGGLFNRRKRATALVKKHRSERLYYDAKRLNTSEVRRLYKRVIYWEKQIEIATAQFKTSQRNFDTLLQNYMAKKSRFIDLRQGLIDQKNAHIFWEEAKFFHLVRKVGLAQKIGVEDFPGDNFEEVAQTGVKRD